MSSHRERPSTLFGGKCIDALAETTCELQGRASAFWTYFAGRRRVSGFAGATSWRAGVDASPTFG